MNEQDRIAFSVLTICQTQTVMFEIFDIEGTHLIIPLDFITAASRPAFATNHAMDRFVTNLYAGSFNRTGQNLHDIRCRNFR